MDQHCDMFAARDGVMAAQVREIATGCCSVDSSIAQRTLIILRAPHPTSVH
jgi:hypothetical protein